LICQKKFILSIVFILTLFCTTVLSNKSEASIESNTHQELISSYIQLHNKTVSKPVANRIAHETIVNSKKYNIRPSLIIGIIKVESNFNHKAKGKRGAIGLMQVMPFWAKTFGFRNTKELYIIENNINCGSRVLTRYTNSSKGNIDKALNLYVGGNKKYSKKVYKAEADFIRHKEKRNKKES